MKCLLTRSYRGGVDRTEVTFSSGAAHCAGWLYRPTGASGDVACVAMSHGLSLTRHDGLAPYAEALAGAGAAVLVYDHRRLGDSGGQPRQRIQIAAQLQDRRAAIEYARGLDGIDADKIVVWGYSLSGGSAVKAAASDSRLAGAILLCPLLDGFSRILSMLRTDPRNVAWLLAHAVKDSIGDSLIPVTAEPGLHGVLNFVGEAQGFKSVTPPNSPWRNEAFAAPILMMALYRPVTCARKLTCPVLVQLGGRDISVSARAIEKLAQRAERAELKRYDLDHFQPFYGDGHRRIAADQEDWLRRTIIAKAGSPR